MSDDIIKHFQIELQKTIDIMEVQIVVPMRLKGELSCYNLNTKIQPIFNPPFGQDNDNYIEIPLSKKNEDYKCYKIRIGDKVINTKNNYRCVNSNGQNTPVFNGNIGIVKSIENRCCIVDFVGLGEIVLSNKEVKSLELAYAISIHKSQGSGFNSAIVGLDGSSYILNNAELLYTALTRAKKYCVLVGKNSAIRSAISKKEIKTKQTFLKDMLETKIG